jgi:hypothetical protein
VLARIAAFALSRPSLQRFAFRAISQIAIRYRDSFLAQSLPGLPEGAPRAGDRFPWLKLKLRQDGPVEDLFQKLDETRFNLLLIGQSVGADSPAAADSSLSPGAALFRGAANFGELLLTHAIPANAANDAQLRRAGIPSISFYLVRADGHVSLCGTQLDTATLQRHLTERLRLIPTTSLA